MTEPSRPVSWCLLWHGIREWLIFLTQGEMHEKSTLLLLTEMCRIIAASALFTLISRGILGGNGSMNPKGTTPTSVLGHAPIYGVQTLSTPRWVSELFVFPTHASVIHDNGNNNNDNDNAKLNSCCEIQPIYLRWISLKLHLFGGYFFWYRSHCVALAGLKLNV